MTLGWLKNQTPILYQGGPELREAICSPDSLWGIHYNPEREGFPASLFHRSTGYTVAFFKSIELAHACAVDLSEIQYWVRLDFIGDRPPPVPQAVQDYTKVIIDSYEGATLHTYTEHSKNQ